MRVNEMMLGLTFLLTFLNHLKNISKLNLNKTVLLLTELYNNGK